MPYIFSPDLVKAREQDLKDIHAAVATYYEGVERAKGELLEAVFHDRWLMKDTDNPGASSLNVEDKRTFLKRVRDHGPYAGYAEDRRVVSVGTAYGELAFVRVDKDSSPMCTCFFLFETGGGGAWSTRRGSIRERTRTGSRTSRFPSEPCRGWLRTTIKASRAPMSRGSMGLRFAQSWRSLSMISVRTSGSYSRPT